ncbi:IS110 family RNA-guided transposase [Taibaiella soli]|nr:IS110 family transposase [Taibaiella soli]
MKKEKQCYLGIDVSKSWFDLSMISVIDNEKQAMISVRFNNDEQGIKQLNKWLKENEVPFNGNSLLVVENTGVYHRLLWAYCSNKNLPIHIGNAAQIKWSQGITRGKNDLVDSQRLCIYCLRHADDLKATPALDPVLLKLKDLFTARSRLISQCNSINVYLHGLKRANTPDVQQLMESAHKPATEGLKKSLEEVEAQILRIITASEAIKRSYDLLLSVPGIGHVTTIYLICCTNNFAGNVSGKQLASYAGVVPFGHSSGSSIRGRNKVHKMANKELKKLLHMGARSVATHNSEFRNYYERKKAEGKHDLAIINAIRNKMVLRVVAVIKNQRKYVDNYQKAA